MNTTPIRGWYLFWSAAIIAGGLACHVFNPGGVATRLQDISLGVFERFKPRAAASRTVIPVRYVDIGAESIAARGPWPWPRSDLARLVEILNAAGAKVIVLDVPLDGRDPVSPARLAQSLPESADGMALRATYGLLPDPDLALAAAMEQGSIVTRFALGSTGKRDLSTLGSPLRSDPRATRWIPTHRSAEPPFAPLAAKSVGIGAALPLANGTVAYRLPLVVNIGGEVRPTVLLEAARVALGAPRPEVTAFEPLTPQDRWLGRPGPAELVLGKAAIPLTRHGELVFHSTASPPRALSAAALLNGAVIPDVKGAMVVVGASGADTAAALRTPGGQMLPATAVLAEGLGQILDGRFVTRPLWADAGEELFILVAGLAVCLLLAYAPLSWSLLMGITAVAGVGALSWLSFSRELWFLDPLLPGLAIALALIAGVRGRLRATEAAEAEGAMPGMVVPAPTSGWLPTLRPAAIADTGERRVVTVLSCQLRDFDDILARYQPNPSALTRLIAAYHEAISDVVVRNKGAIALLRGPQVIAYWNGNIADAEHAASACNCALRLINALEKVNENLADDARSNGLIFDPITVSMGIETGECLLGLTSSGRAELVAVGETVALAETLQARSETYGPTILVGEHARAEAEKLFALLEIDLIRVPNHDTPVHIYALFGNPLVRASPKFRALEATHQEIFSAYRAQNWSLARALVNECRKLPAAAEKLYDLYESRIAELERLPPGPGWDGAHSLEAA